MAAKNDLKINTPIPPQRQFPQEKPDSEQNRGINQKPDPERKEEKKNKPDNR